MKTYIRRREKNKELVVLYGGWGVDENLLIPLCTDDHDFILFYDYSADEALLLPEIKPYSKITLIGWSFGVWTAGYMLSKTSIKPDIKIAVGGTPNPVDNKYGIPLSLIERKLNTLTEKDINKFFYRMFGNKNYYFINKERIPHRTLKSLVDELRWLYNRMTEYSEQDFKWDYAVIPEKDRIFPVKSQLNYWKNHTETETIVLPMQHYIFQNWTSYFDFINFVTGQKSASKN
mgnify:FL=1